MSEQAIGVEADSHDWKFSKFTRLGIKALTGVIAIFIAIKALGMSPGDPAGYSFQEHLFKMIAFLSLTVWMAISIGLNRCGAAAMTSLAFASIVEFFVLRPQAEGMETLVSANLGIVLAYCGLQLYAYQKRNTSD